jgi:SAM-dependent methyltransferase
VIEVRLAHIYIASDTQAHEPARQRPDSSLEQFEETMHYAADARRLTSRQAFHERFAAETWINELHAVLRSLLQPGRRTLGLGSGFGEHELRFALLGYDITASDVVMEPLAHTASLFPEFKYRRVDIFEPAPAGEWDDVLISGMDSYFDDAAAQKLFERAAALLRGPGPGRLIFVLRYKSNLATWLIDQMLTLRASLLNARHRYARRGPRWVRQAHGFRRSEGDILRLARRAGFTPKRIAHAGFGFELTRLAFLARLDELLGGALTRADRRLHLLNNCTIIELVLTGGS